jgi:hypothetical protein
MKRKLFNLILSTSIFVAAGTHAADKVEYPDGYRTWTHIKTMVLHEGHPLENPFMGIHHVYANEQGVQGTQSGQFDDGAVLVFDLLEYVTQDNASTEGDRVLLGVMVKDGERFGATGGWGFEGFAGDSRTERLTDDGGQSCFACHASQKDTDYVFSRWRE